MSIFSGIGSWFGGALPSAFDPRRWWRDESDVPVARLDARGSVSGPSSKVGVVLSGGGTRAAYQVGVLKALAEDPLRNKPISVIVGSSIGAVNSLLLAMLLKDGFPTAIARLSEVWREREYSNTFAGSPARAFVRALNVLIRRYSNPGPQASSMAIFDPSPLERRIDEILREQGGLTLENLPEALRAVAVITTVEGPKRKPLLYACAKDRIPLDRLIGAPFSVQYREQLKAAHALASAALPSVLPPVQLYLEDEQVHLVDGGISDNLPVDPALRLGAEEIIIVDVSGRKWWLDRFEEPGYRKPSWVAELDPKSYCLCPTSLLHIHNVRGLGMLLKEAVGRSRKDFLAALGPTWPIYRALKYRLGEEMAYEVMSYIALHPAYVDALIEQGYNDAKNLLAARHALVVQEPERIPAVA